jgi:hypothetical protein
MVWHTGPTCGQRASATDAPARRGLRGERTLRREWVAITCGETTTALLTMGMMTLLRRLYALGDPVAPVMVHAQ